ncbi:unnamed protein product [Zymoseptoria tritici ST99CH_3D7]|uniref:Uncharacterized protein n=1 Tax=Zymoseptoria tritici (strain ST99CH_3D7) TaxID=1276538 RepID=A0A1X7S7A0_ZYMT9|nr:unnamed protein product [Zymoseptoria tritici ST99CH_3D7]
MEPPPVKACLFDMDGLLLNTEDLITVCINIILRKYGKQDLPWSLKARIQGRSAEASDEILQDWAQMHIDKDEYKRQQKALHDRIFPTSEPLPGVVELLRRLDSTSGVSLALATSSTQAIFKTKTAGCRSLFDCFPHDCQVLGDDPRVEHHKPAPDIYLQALACVNDRRETVDGQDSVTAAECLVLEDSIQGVDAGKRAGMQVLWVPHRGLLHELLQGDIANDDVRKHFQEVFGLDPKVPIRGLEIEALADHIQEATLGWIRMLTSLEHFPYALYGLSN